MSGRGEAAAWKFRDEPDWARICRELREAGCALGLVTVEKSDAAPAVFTLCDYGARMWPPKTLYGLETMPGAERVFKAHEWRRFPCNAIKALLQVPEVRVFGFK